MTALPISSQQKAQIDGCPDTQHSASYNPSDGECLHSAEAVCKL